ncbi:MAG: Cell division protein FtsA [Parcubacteria group bacterium GW2011_GWA2_47_21]|nr:MAG: Cell division protein FtsA [Parcubacteria group bacterium GW2011_GWA2_47_21]
MSFSIFKKDTRWPVIIFDVGSGSVGAAVAVINGLKKPAVLYSTREILPVRTEINADKLLSSKRSALKSAMEKIIKTGLPLFSKNNLNISRVPVFVTFSAPWYLSRPVAIKINKPKPFIINADLISSIIKTAKEDLLGEIKQKKGTAPVVSIIEEKIVQVRLAGYKTDNFFMRQTNDFSAVLFITAIPTSVAKECKRLLGPISHPESFHLHSFGLSYYSVVKDLFPQSSDYILMDVTGEATDLALVEDGALTETLSFPYGRNTLIREISARLKISPEVARSLLQIHYQGKIEQKSSLKFEESVAAAGDKWQTVWRESLDALSDKAILPKRVYLTADGEDSRFFSELIQKEPCDRSTFGGHCFEIFYLSDDKLKNLVDFDRHSKPDAFITIEALLAQKIINNHPR